MCLHPVSFKGSLSSYQIRDVHSFLVCSFLYLSGILPRPPPTNSSFASTALSRCCRCRRNEERRCRRRPRSAIFTFRRPRAGVSLVGCRRCQLSQAAPLLLAANRQTAAPLLPWPPRPRDEPTRARQNAATMRTDSSSSIFMNTLT